MKGGGAAGVATIGAASVEVAQQAWFTGSRFALAVGKWAAIALSISLFLLSLRRSGERAGRLVERLENREKANEIQSRMLEATARRPRNRDELVALRA